LWGKTLSKGRTSGGSQERVRGAKGGEMGKKRTPEKKWVE